MAHPRELNIADFTYELPDERIAKYPLDKRDESKLLIYRQAEIKESQYKSLTEYVPSNALLIFNDTRVVQARLLFENRNGRLIEVFCLEPATDEKDITLAMSKVGQVTWKCLVGGAKKWKEEQLSMQLSLADESITLQVQKKERVGANFIIEFSWNSQHSFSEILEKAGKTPLPPYMKREAEQEDKTRYQTVFAQHDGSVAAPTSGLHFTPHLLEKLKNKGIKEGFVTLHVGAGTFKPVSADLLEEHEMHFEFIQVQSTLIERLLKHEGLVIPVGTTSMRTIESLYWLGVKVSLNPSLPIKELVVNQWDAYELADHQVKKEVALQALSTYMSQHNLSEVLTKTQLMIAPGYTLKIAEGIVTNFHQPKSTLILLVAAMIGKDWKKVYDYALANEFRFLSYGDGCLLFPN